MPIQQLANYVQTTLASGCTAGAGTISVVSAAGLPTVGNFMLRIDDAAPATTYEYVECTGVSGTTLTVTRGQEGTTGIAHIAGAIVGNDLSAGMLGRGFVQPIRARGYRAAAQSLTGAGFQKILIDTVSFDPVSGWDVVTNHRWTCPTGGGGYYLVVGGANFTGTTGRFIACIYKNGVIEAQGADGYVSAGGGTGAQVSDVIPLVAGDYLELWIYNNAGTPVEAGGPQLSYLALHFLSVT